MNENTTKVEGVSFTAKDEGASAAAEKIGHAFERVHHAAEGAKAKVGDWARSAAMGTMASLGLGFGLHAVYEKAKEANLAMDKVEKSLTGTLYAMQGWKKGTSEMDKMTFSMKQAAEQTEHLEDMELKLRTPIEELNATYNAVATTGFAKLGMGQKEVLEMTERITAAAKVYGISGSEAMMKVNRVLIMGKVSQRDISGLGEKLRESLHLKSKEKIGPEELMRRMNKGLGDMVPLAQKMSQNFSGNLFEAGALVEKMIEDLSRPMFKEQANSIAEWVTKLRSVREDGKSIMEIYGEKIAGAFRTMKDVTKFLVDNWKIIAGIFVTTKIASMASGLAGRFGTSAASAAGAAGAAMGTMNVSAGTVNVNSAAAGQALGAGVGQALKPGLVTTTAKLAGMAAKLTLVTDGLAMYAGVLAVAWKSGEQLGDWIGDPSSKNNSSEKMKAAAHHFERSVAKVAVAGYTQHDLEKQAQARGLPMAQVQALALKHQLAEKESARGTMRTALDALGLKQGQQVTQGQTTEMLRAMGPELAAATMTRLSELMPTMIHKHTAGEMELSPLDAARELTNAMNEYAAKLFSGAGASEEGPNVKRKVAKNPQINIGNMNITQEFKEADPDRVFHRMMNDVQETVTSPSRGAVGMNLAGGMT